MLCSCLKSQLSCVPEQNRDTGEIGGLQRMPNRTSLMMLLHLSWCQQKLLGNSSDFCYWCKLSSLWSGAFLFNALCTFPVLFENAMLNSLQSPSPAPRFFHTSNARTLASLTYHLAYADSSGGDCWKLSAGKKTNIQKGMIFWMERSLTSIKVNFVD